MRLTWCKIVKKLILWYLTLPLQPETRNGRMEEVNI